MASVTDDGDVIEDNMPIIARFKYTTAPVDTNNMGTVTLEHIKKWTEGIIAGLDINWTQTKVALDFERYGLL